LDVKKVAYGKWESIHRALGIQLKTTSHTKHTACQGCGGKDRFRVMADYGNTGKWFCGGGGDQQSGDGFALLEHVFGLDSKQQLKAVADVLGLTKLDNSERIKMRVKISAFAEKQAEYNRKKAHSMNRNRNIKELAEDLIDAVKRKEYFQRLANKASSFDIIQDTQLEYDILKAIRKIYADEYKPSQEVNHA